MNSIVKEVLIIAKDISSATSKFEELVRLRDSINASSIKAIVFNRSMRGIRANTLYISKNLTIEEVEYCRRYRLSYSEEETDIVFF